MELVQYNKDLLVGKGWYRKTKNQKLLDDFINSGFICAEVKDFTNMKARYCHSSLLNTIKKFGYNGIRVMTVDERVFLIRKNEEDED